MTTEEFEREFDISYNNIMSNAAPGIDAYEKSVFLTKAQEEIVAAIYDGSFEKTEKSTEYLKDLVVNDYLLPDTDVEPQEKISSNSKLFVFPDNAMFIIYEALHTTDACSNSITVPVRPVKHDEYHRISKNPFRKARNTEALRLNRGTYIEIVSTYRTYNYQIRYIRKPYPIILYTVSTQQAPTDYPADLTINGTTVKRTSELPEELHRAILDRAVQMAASVYKQTQN